MEKQRVISAIVAIPLLIIFTLSGGIIFKCGVIAISVIALYEYINVYKNSESKVIISVIAIGAILYYAILLNKSINEALPVIMLVTILSMAAPIFSRKHSVVSSAITTIGFVYVVCFFSFLILIRDYKNGNYLIWVVYIVAWGCDTLAYYVGRKIGKTKLCPLVSPKKTVEGSIGGICGSVIGLILYSLITKKVDFEIYQLLILGIVGAIVSQIGDLSASLIKRYLKVKDYGNIMPGHGGILDRFDSILFVAPVVYYCIVIFLG